MCAQYQAKQLYKTLLYLGRDYPLGYEYFRGKCHRAFIKNRDVTDPQKINELLRFGEYITKEIEALYKLKKYRAIKRMYYDDEQWAASYELKLRKINDAEGQT